MIRVQSIYRQQTFKKKKKERTEEDKKVPKEEINNKVNKNKDDLKEKAASKIQKLYRRKEGKKKPLVRMYNSKIYQIIAKVKLTITDNKLEALILMKIGKVDDQLNQGKQIKYFKIVLEGFKKRRESNLLSIHREFIPNPKKLDEEDLHKLIEIKVEEHQILLKEPYKSLQYNLVHSSKIEVEAVKVNNVINMGKDVENTEDVIKKLSEPKLDQFLTIEITSGMNNAKQSSLELLIHQEDTSIPVFEQLKEEDSFKILQDSKENKMFENLKEDIPEEDKIFENLKEDKPEDFKEDTIFENLKEDIPDDVKKERIFENIKEDIPDGVKKEIVFENLKPEEDKIFENLKENIPQEDKIFENLIEDKDKPEDIKDDKKFENLKDDKDKHEDIKDDKIFENLKEDKHEDIKDDKIFENLKEYIPADVKDDKIIENLKEDKSEMLSEDVVKNIKQDENEDIKEDMNEIKFAADQQIEKDKNDPKGVAEQIEDDSSEVPKLDVSKNNIILHNIQETETKSYNSARSQRSQHSFKSLNSSGILKLGLPIENKVAIVENIELKQDELPKEILNEGKSNILEEELKTSVRKLSMSSSFLSRKSNSRNGFKVPPISDKEKSFDTTEESNSIIELKYNLSDFIPKNGTTHLVFEKNSFSAKIEFNEEKKEVQITYKQYSNSGISDDIKVRKLILGESIMGVNDMNREQFFENYDMLIFPRLYEENGLLQFKQKNF